MADIRDLAIKKINTAKDFVNLAANNIPDDRKKVILDIAERAIENIKNIVPESFTSKKDKESDGIADGKFIIDLENDIRSSDHDLIERNVNDVISALNSSITPVIVEEVVEYNKVDDSLDNTGDKSDKALDEKHKDEEGNITEGSKKVKELVDKFKKIEELKKEINDMDNTYKSNHQEVKNKTLILNSKRKEISKLEAEILILEEAERKRIEEEERKRLEEEERKRLEEEERKRLEAEASVKLEAELKKKEEEERKKIEQELIKFGIEIGQINAFLNDLQDKNMPVSQLEKIFEELKQQTLNSISKIDKSNGLVIQINNSIIGIQDSFVRRKTEEIEKINVINTYIIKNIKDKTKVNELLKNFAEYNILKQTDSKSFSDEIIGELKNYLTYEKNKEHYKSTYQTWENNIKYIINEYSEKIKTYNWEPIKKIFSDYNMKIAHMANTSEKNKPGKTPEISEKIIEVADFNSYIYQLQEINAPSLILSMMIDDYIKDLQNFIKNKGDNADSTLGKSIVILTDNLSEYTKNTEYQKVMDLIKEINDLDMKGNIKDMIDKLVYLHPLHIQYHYLPAMENIYSKLNKKLTQEDWKAVTEKIKHNLSSIEYDGKYSFDKYFTIRNNFIYINKFIDEIYRLIEVIVPIRIIRGIINTNKDEIKKIYDKLPDSMKQNLYEAFESITRTINENKKEEKKYITKKTREIMDIVNTDKDKKRVMEVMESYDSIIDHLPAYENEQKQFWNKKFMDYLGPENLNVISINNSNRIGELLKLYPDADKYNNNENFDNPVYFDVKKPEGYEENPEGYEENPEDYEENPEYYYYGGRDLITNKKQLTILEAAVKELENDITALNNAINEYANKKKEKDTKLKQLEDDVKIILSELTVLITSGKYSDIIDIKNTLEDEERLGINELEFLDSKSKASKGGFDLPNTAYLKDKKAALDAKLRDNALTHNLYKKVAAKLGGLINKRLIELSKKDAEIPTAAYIAGGTAFLTGWPCSVLIVLLILIIFFFVNKIYERYYDNEDTNPVEYYNDVIYVDYDTRIATNFYDGYGNPYIDENVRQIAKKDIYGIN